MSNTNASAKGARKPLQIAVILGAALLFAAVFAISLFADRGGAAHVQPSLQVVYVKDQQLLAQTTGKQEQKFTVAEQLVGKGISQEDWDYMLYDLGLYAQDWIKQAGTLLFYPQKIESSYDVDQRYELHYRDLADETRSGMLATNVTGYSVSQNGETIVYRRDNGELFTHDLKDSTRLAASSDWYFELHAAGDKLVYSDDGVLYLADLKAGSKPEVIDDQYPSLHSVNEDFTQVYYYKDEAFYVKESGQSAKQLFENVSYIEQIYEDGSMYYTFDEYASYPYEQFVIDDLAEADQGIVEPEIDDYWVTASGDDQTPVFDEVAYEDALDIYWEKMYRDEMREEMSSLTFDDWSSSLYFFDGTQSHLVTSDYDSYSYSYNEEARSQSPFWIYYKEISSENGSILLSELEDIYQLEDILYGYSDYETDEKLYIAFGKDEQILDASFDPYSISVHPSGESIFFLREDEEDAYELVQAQISDGKLINEQVKDNDVSGYYFLGKYWNDEPIYFKNMLEDQLSEDMYWVGYGYVAGDMYIAGEKIDRLVNPNSIFVQPDGTLFYMTQYSSDAQSGTLKRYDGNETTIIGHDVFQYVTLDDGSIVYLRNYNIRKSYGDLYLHIPGQTDQRLDERVSLIAAAHASNDASKTKTQGGK